MANAPIQQNVSIISTLARTRAEIFAAAERDNDRTLTASELDRVASVETVIANSQASDRREAAIQVAVAFDQMERVRDGVADDCALETVYAALRSASRVLAPRHAA